MRVLHRKGKNEGRSFPLLGLNPPRTENQRFGAGEMR
jgi:hypothetical protein